ncbi:methyltransferase [Pontibacillus yanchengensis Y32]|uniref:Methyltransferase n=1 Tax=Pontibacillus yanchengensis Y32 TaxID=1385514 RepID=A0A0A2TDM1_9BACI|nr:methyltransferase [Pontibacillus yanchengensis Y32]
MILTTSFNWHKEVEKKWDQNVTFWSEKSRAMWDHGSRSSIVPFIEKHVGKGSYIGDIGCGDGYGSYKLKEAGYDVIGVDLSPKMVEHANKVCDENLCFKLGDLASLPFEDNTFDALIAINSIEWTEEPYLALKELKRVLKPGGLLCVGLLGPTAGPRQNSFRRLLGESVICNTMMPWEFEQLALESSWSVIDGQGVYKEGVKPEHYETLPKQLKQALTFMWLFMFQKE